MKKLEATQEEMQAADPERSTAPLTDTEEESLFKLLAPDVATLCVFVMIVVTVCLILWQQNGGTIGRIWDPDPGSGEEGENDLIPYSEER